MDIQFSHPEYLYFLLLLIPLLVLSGWSYWRRRRLLQRFADKELGKKLTPLASGKKYVLRDLLLLAAGALVIVVLARPQLRNQSESTEAGQGIEAMICLDISNSMLCEDIAPNRLEWAKRSITQLLDKMRTDRVGLIVFAGSAFVQLPITTDLAAAQEFLADISPDMLSDQGTAIGDAITLARQSLSERKDLGKAVIVFTDGEDFEGNALESAKAASSAGAKVEIIGVGTEKGGPIPTPQGNLTDDQGQMVITHFNAEKCKEIAEAGGGAFITSSSTTGVVQAIQKELESLPRGTLTNTNNQSAIEAFEPWLWTALVLLLIEFFVMGRKNKFLIRHNIFGHEK